MHHVDKYSQQSSIIGRVFVYELSGWGFESRCSHVKYSSVENRGPFRAYSTSLSRAIIARNHLPFFKIFSNFIHFCPNFQIICSSLPFFCPFSEKSHACPYFLEIPAITERDGIRQIQVNARKKTFENILKERTSLFEFYFHFVS